LNKVTKTFDSRKKPSTMEIPEIPNGDDKVTFDAPTTSEKTSTGAPKVDEKLLARLLEMGLPPIRAQRALLMTRNRSAEDAANW